MKQKLIEFLKKVERRVGVWTRENIVHWWITVILVVPWVYVVMVIAWLKNAVECVYEALMESWWDLLNCHTDFFRALKNGHRHVKDKEKRNVESIG